MTEQEQPTTSDEETSTDEPEQERDAPAPEGGHGPASKEEPPENGDDDE
jgi:hypothetical protein